MLAGLLSACTSHITVAHQCRGVSSGAERNAITLRAVESDLVSQYHGAYKTVSGDPGTWGQKTDKITAFAKSVKKMYDDKGIPCFGDSVIWDRCKQFPTTRRGDPFGPKDRFWHKGELGDQMRLETILDEAEKQITVLADMLTLFRHNKDHLEDLANEGIMLQ